MKGTTVYLAFNRISDAYVQESFIPEKTLYLMTLPPAKKPPRGRNLRRLLTVVAAALMTIALAAAALLTVKWATTPQPPPDELWVHNDLCLTVGSEVFLPEKYLYGIVEYDESKGDYVTETFGWCPEDRAAAINAMPLVAYTKKTAFFVREGCIFREYYVYDSTGVNLLYIGNSLKELERLPDGLYVVGMLVYSGEKSTTAPTELNFYGFRLLRGDVDPSDYPPDFSQTPTVTAGGEALTVSLYAYADTRIWTDNGWYEYTPGGTVPEGALPALQAIREGLVDVEGIHYAADLRLYLSSSQRLETVTVYDCDGMPVAQGNSLDVCHGLSTDLYFVVLRLCELRFYGKGEQEFPTRTVEYLFRLNVDQPFGLTEKNGYKIKNRMPLFAADVASLYADTTAAAEELIPALKQYASILPKISYAPNLTVSLPEGGTIHGYTVLDADYTPVLDGGDVLNQIPSLPEGTYSVIAWVTEGESETVSALLFAVTYEWEGDKRPNTAVTIRTDYERYPAGITQIEGTMLGSYATGSLLLVTDSWTLLRLTEEGEWAEVDCTPAEPFAYVQREEEKWYVSHRFALSVDEGLSAGIYRLYYENGSLPVPEREYPKNPFVSDGTVPYFDFTVYDGEPPASPTPDAEDFYYTAGESVCIVPQLIHFRHVTLKYQNNGTSEGSLVGLDHTYITHLLPTLHYTRGDEVTIHIPESKSTNTVNGLGGQFFLIGTDGQYIDQNWDLKTISELEAGTYYLTYRLTLFDNYTVDGKIYTEETHNEFHICLIVETPEVAAAP